MTKEQAMKHKEVIKWWLENTDKGVWELTSIGWELTYTPNFYPADKYIQNDKYAEYRKAIADGKTIEFKERNDNIWYKITVNITPTRNFNSIYEYRIKSEEPNFKIGDWVIYGDGSVLQIEKLETITHQIGTDILFHSKGLKLPLKYAKKWQPQDGEWCVFWENDKEYFIGKYGFNAISPTFGVHCNEIDITYTELGWNNVAPLEFIETLKEK